MHALASGGLLPAAGRARAQAYKHTLLAAAWAQAYAARFPTGAQPAAGGFGDINSNHWFSQNVGPMHVVVMNSLLPYLPGTPQWNFVAADLAAVDRTATPWVIVNFHMPMYNTCAAGPAVA